MRFQLAAQQPPKNLLSLAVSGVLFGREQEKRRARESQREWLSLWLILWLFLSGSLWLSLARSLFGSLLLSFSLALSGSLWFSVSVYLFSLAVSGSLWVFLARTATAALQRFQVACTEVRNFLGIKVGLEKC